MKFQGAFFSRNREKRSTDNRVHGETGSLFGILNSRCQNGLCSIFFRVNCRYREMGEKT